MNISSLGIFKKLKKLSLEVAKENDYINVDTKFIKDMSNLQFFDITGRWKDTLFLNSLPLSLEYLSISDFYLRHNIFLFIIYHASNQDLKD